MADKKKADDNSWRERIATLGRNDECTCGSGKKYKKCHLESDEKMKSGELAKTNEEAKAKFDQEAAAHGEEHGHEGHDHPPGHGHDRHTHGPGPGDGGKPHGPSSMAKQVNAPRKVGSG